MPENAEQHALIQKGMDSGVVVHEIGFRAHGSGVVMHLPKMANYVFIDAETARGAAEQLGRCAYEANFGHEPPASKRSIIRDTKVQLLRRRLELMLATFAREGKLSGDPDENARVSQSIVDTVLSEVL